MLKRRKILNNDGFYKIFASPLSVVASASSPDTEAPTVPANLAASSITATTLTLAWDASTDDVGVVSYEVQRKLASAGNETYAWEATVVAPTVTLAVTGLTEYTAYRFRVRAIDAAENASAWSPTDTGLAVTTADETAPTVPGLMVASAIAETTLTLTWGASTDAVSVLNYRVEQAIGEGAFAWLATVAAPTVTLDVTGLTESTAYRFRVLAEDASGNQSAWEPDADGLSVTTTALTILASGYLASSLASWGNSPGLAHGAVRSNGDVILMPSDLNGSSSTVLGANACAKWSDFAGSIMFFGHDGLRLTEPPIIMGTSVFATSDTQGGVFLWGNFSSVNGVARNKLAHLDATGVVTDWNPGSTVIPSYATADSTHVYVTIDSQSSENIRSTIGGVLAGMHKVNRVTGLSTAVSSSRIVGCTLYPFGDYVYWATGKSHNSYGVTVAGASNRYFGRFVKSTGLNDGTWNLTHTGSLNARGEWHVSQGWAYFLVQGSVGGLSTGRVDVASPTVDEVWGSPGGGFSHLKFMPTVDDPTYIYYNVTSDVRYPPTVGGGTARLVCRIPHNSPILDTWGLTSVSTVGSNLNYVLTTIYDNKVWFFRSNETNLIINGVTLPYRAWAMDLATLTTVSGGYTDAKAFGTNHTLSTKTKLVATSSGPVTTTALPGAYAQETGRLVIQNKLSEIITALEPNGGVAAPFIQQGEVLVRMATGTLSGVAVTSPAARLLPPTYAVDPSWAITPTPVNPTFFQDDPFSSWAYCASAPFFGPSVAARILWRYNPTTGVVDQSWWVDGSAGNCFVGVAYDNTYIYVTTGSATATVNGTLSPWLARITKADGTLDTEWTPPSLNTDNIQLRILGDLMYIWNQKNSPSMQLNGAPRTLARFNKDTGVVDTGWTPDTGWTAIYGCTATFDLTGTFPYVVMVPREANRPARVASTITGNYRVIDFAAVTSWSDTRPLPGRTYLSQGGEFIAAGTTQGAAMFIPPSLGVIAFDVKDYLP